jgi:hypothetical protein
VSEYRLTKEIVAASEASTWEEAKAEWRLHTIYFAETWQTCLCTHYPIKEVCVLLNAKNGALVEVGNVCVTKFVGIDSDKVFRAIKKVTADPSKSLNEEAIKYAFSKCWVNQWERKFLLNTQHKRKLTRKQAVKRVEINKMVVQRVAQGKNLS